MVDGRPARRDSARERTFVPRRKVEMRVASSHENHCSTTMTVQTARTRPERVCLALSLGAVLALVAFQREKIDVLLNQSWTTRTGGNSTKHESAALESATRIPSELLSLGLYTCDDFTNDAGVAPPFWKLSSVSPCSTNSSATKVRSPCYVPSRSGRVDWKSQANLSSHLSPRYHTSPISASTDARDLADYCRPGFIIIGAGKCGTRYEVKPLGMHNLFSSFRHFIAASSVP